MNRREFGAMTTGAALAGVVGGPQVAQAQARFNLGVIAFQMSSETHARAANAARDAAQARGWSAQVLNSRGDLAVHAQQIEDLIQARVNGIVVCMGKPVEADDQLKRAKEANIPLITVMTGTSPHTAFDIQVNEYSVGAQSALYLLGQMNYRGNILVQRFELNVGTRIRARILDAVLAENTAVTVLGAHTMARTASWRDDVRAGMSALLLRHQGRVDGIWASFDGQAYIIDDLLREQQGRRGRPVLVSIDGGPETYRRIADPASTLMATVMIPFEEMGRKAVESMHKIAVERAAVNTIVAGPYMYMDAVLVDQHNVRQFL
jgi:ribose transport system substrate-binding protein